MYSATAIVRNRTGLHARPAAQFVGKAGEFQSRITIRNNSTGRSCSAKSIIMLLKLAIAADTEVEITAEGSDEQQAVGQLIALIEEGFGE